MTILFNFTARGNDTVINTNGEGTITIIGIPASEVDECDFIFHGDEEC